MGARLLTRKAILFLLTLMLLQSDCIHARSWGELRFTETAVNIRADRSIYSKVVGKLRPGDSVKVDFLRDNWYAVFSPGESIRDESYALGYVYAPFLKQEITDDRVASVGETYCKLKDGHDVTAVQELLSQLSRLSDTYYDDLPGLLKRKTIRVLTIYSLTSYFLSNGRGNGFEYSLLKDYQRFLNRNKAPGALRVVVEFIPVHDNLLIPCLKAGLGDIVAAGLTITPELNREVDFTEPYLDNIYEVLVGNKNTKQINEFSDLAGRQIYVRRVSSYYEGLGRLNEKLRALGLDPVSIIKAEDFLTSEDIMEMVNAGIIDLSITESHLANLWSQVLPNLVTYEQIPLQTGRSIAWMVRENNPILQASLNEFIRGHKKGTLYGNIYFSRYFRKTEWIKNPLTSDDGARFSQYTPLFKKYGAMYGIDWMLLAALAYQESGMKHSSRSPAGAMGLMQVMPATAMDKPVAIENVHLLENNIHAGTKYLAWLRDTYFTDENMAPTERIRYSLASYNAGPSMIRRARSLAAKMGYDPNHWFRHGEIGALKLIGEETVRYVSNINKYYLAYSLAGTLTCLRDQRLQGLR